MGKQIYGTDRIPYGKTIDTLIDIAVGEDGEIPLEDRKAVSLAQASYNQSEESNAVFQSSTP
jgi:hypothetical protein